MIPNESNPQSWNRFSYVEGNPIKHKDPTGHDPVQALVDAHDSLIEDSNRFAEAAVENLSSGTAEGVVKGSVQALGSSTLYWVAELGLPADRAEAETQAMVSMALTPAGGVAEHAVAKIAEKVGKTGTKAAPKLLKVVSQLGRAQKAISEASPLDLDMKKALRAQAQRIMAKANPAYVRAVSEAAGGAKDIPVHHRIPLEWAHLMGEKFNPNAAENLVALTKGNHDKISAEWKVFKERLRGQQPSAEDLKSMAKAIDERYGSGYIKE